MIPRNRHRRRRHLALSGLVFLSVGLCAGPAAAWDPSTTHQGLLESAVTRSAVHLRWMDASELERGVFTSLRVDPNLLTPAQMRLLQLTMRSAHADVGALPLGGPGACPSADAPPETQQFCVDQDVWEHSALGWLRLGILAEVTPSARHLHHFLDLEQPESLRWSDEDLSAGVLRRRQARANGEPAAGVATRTNFSGQATSAIAWLEDPNDPLAPPQTYQHLAQASHAATQAERDHHLALAMLGVGALLHVAQDLSVPAHARGDATAFFAPLSPAPGDRGLPLQEFARFEYGRSDLPGRESGATTTPAPTLGAPSGVPLSETLVGHLLGDAQYDGLTELAGRHFFSESSVPSPKLLDDTLSASVAATALFGDEHHLAAVEIDGAVLSPWPAQRGYVLSSTGRALAAFDTDLDGRTRPYLDEACYRDQAALLLPAAADVTRSLLDLLWPAWPTMQRSGGEVVLAIPAWASAELTLSIQSDDGERRTISQQALEVGIDNAVSLGAEELAAGERVVLILSATRVDGPPIIIEQMLPGSAPSREAAPMLTPPAGSEPGDPDPGDPDPGDPEPGDPGDPEPEGSELDNPELPEESAPPDPEPPLEAPASVPG